jgi:hypothetical protein
MKFDEIECPNCGKIARAGKDAGAIMRMNGMRRATIRGKAAFWRHLPDLASSEVVRRSFGKRYAASEGGSGKPVQNYPADTCRKGMDL